MFNEYETAKRIADRENVSVAKIYSDFNSFVSQFSEDEEDEVL